jgi:hypothetical protein
MAVHWREAVLKDARPRSPHCASEGGDDRVGAAAAGIHEHSFGAHLQNLSD